MKKILTAIFSIMLVASLASCGNDNNGNNNDPSEPNYMMLYRAIIPVSAFNFGNPTLSLYNPSTKQTVDVTLTLDQDNHNATDFISDYRTACAILSLSGIDPNDFFFYYYKVSSITKDMKYEATLKLNIDNEKAAALDQDAKVKVANPSVGASFYNLTSKAASTMSLSVTSFTLTNAKALTYYSKPTHAEQTISGTVVLP